MEDYSKKPLFIFDLANNHQGNVDHGLKIIRQVKEVCREFNFNFAFKFQYRDIDTFIHPDFKNAFNIKNIKRFCETRLSDDEFKVLKSETDCLGFISICTAFDEKSVDLIEKHCFDIIKIASCSFTDWPLLERIGEVNKPVIASTAGAKIEDIDKVVSFFTHRGKDISLMHCVAEYPTKKENLQLNQIDLLREKYKDVCIGYSTHEDPNNFDAVKLAAAKGAVIFEKHVGVKTDTISLNAYSAEPEQIYRWLKSAEGAFDMCGVKGQRHNITEKEIDDLRSLQRGMYAKRLIRKGEKINNTNVYFAIPGRSGQIFANDTTKYKEIAVEKDIAINEPVMVTDVKVSDIRQEVEENAIKVIDILKKSNTIIPVNAKCELSHHYGLERFGETGGAIINCINREYCKKIMVLLPGQRHPSHAHKLKEETFTILYGEMNINLNGEEKKYKSGDIILIQRDVMHSFNSKTGAVFEEISTTHYSDDSYYEDITIMENKNRKTEVYLTQELF